MTVTVFGNLILISIGFLRFYFSVFSLVLVSIEKIYQTLQTVFHRLSKHLEFRQIYSTAHLLVNSLLGVWISQWNTVLCLIYYIPHAGVIYFRLILYQLNFSHTGYLVSLQWLKMGGFGPSILISHLTIDLPSWCLEHNFQVKTGNDSSPMFWGTQRHCTMSVRRKRTPQWMVILILM